MSQRVFVKTCGWAVGICILLGTAQLADAEDAKKPNILFIMTDQQHAGMMSCTGNKWLKTPAMDALAASGIRFERAYACNPVCVPSRISFMTAEMPSAFGVRDNGTGSRAKIPEEVLRRSMGRLFKDAGYEMAYGGKVHLPRALAPANCGFNYICRDERQALADACAEFIKKPHEKPFFLVASFINPHDICYMAINDHARSQSRPKRSNVAAKTLESLLEKANKGDVSQFVKKNCPPVPGNLDVPDGESECITTAYTKTRSFREYARKEWSDDLWRLHRWAYCRLTEMVDAEMATVLDALREAGLEDDTLVVFTSDHGDMDSAHRLEHKTVLYEESVRVPFVMSYKGVIPSGEVDETHLVSNGLDLIPTLCDYAGVSIPKELHGRSLRPVADGKAPDKWRDFVVSESSHGRMLRTERFKYTVYESGKNREWLVDLEKDPGEMKNLAGDPKYKDVLEKHRKLLCQWVKETGDRIAEPYLVRP